MRLTVVIADDDISTCNGIKSVITSKFPEFVIKGIFYEGDSLYEYITSKHVDIVISDINLPGKSGLDISEYLHQKNKGTYIILITGFLKFEYAKQAIDYQVDYFLTKPFSIPELIEKLQIIEKNIAMNISEAQNRSELYKNNWCFLRKCFQELYDSGVVSEDFYRQRLLNNTVGPDGVKCAEYSFTVPPGINLQDLFDAIIDYGEFDSIDMSAFFLADRKNKFVFLVLYVTEIPASYHDDFVKRIYMDYGVTLVYDIHFFDSILNFADYRKARAVWLEYTSLSSMNNLKAAEYLNNTMQALTIEQLTYLIKEAFCFYGISTNISSPKSHEAAISEMQRLILKENKAAQANAIVALAQDYINTHYNNINLSMNDIANNLNITPNYLSKLFKSINGKNYISYLTDVRINHAIDLLVHTNIPIEQISTAVGYNQDTYFRKVFKKQTGFSPSKYRYMKKLKERNE